MAPLPFNGTHIAFVDYSGNSGEHTAFVRIDPAASAGDVNSKASQYAQLIAGVLLQDATVTGTRIQLVGTNFSVPGTQLPIPGTKSGQLQEENAPRFISFVGRSTGGRRVRYYIYNTPYGQGPDYRIDGGFDPELLALYTFLRDDGGIVAIDGQQQTVYGYVNVGFNSYYQRKQRQLS